jgi:hypothetical protein
MRTNSLSPSENSAAALAVVLRFLVGASAEAFNVQLPLSRVFPPRKAYPPGSHSGTCHDIVLVYSTCARVYAFQGDEPVVRLN